MPNETTIWVNQEFFQIMKKMVENQVAIYADEIIEEEVAKFRDKLEIKKALIIKNFVNDMSTERSMRENSVNLVIRLGDAR